MKIIFTAILFFISLSVSAAIEYTYESENYRLQIEFIQIMPAKREVHIQFQKINKTTYDIEGYSYVLSGNRFQSFAAITGNEGRRIAKQLNDAAYNWVINTGRVDTMIAGGSQPAGYTRPTLTIN